MDKAFIRKLNLPNTVRGFVIMDGNGDYNIYLNENLADNLVRPTLMHELTHAARGHLTDGDISLKEAEHEASAAT